MKKNAWNEYLHVEDHMTNLISQKSTKTDSYAASILLEEGALLTIIQIPYLQDTLKSRYSLLHNVGDISEYFWFSAWYLKPWQSWEMVIYLY